MAGCRQLIGQELGIMLPRVTKDEKTGERGIVAGQQEPDHQAASTTAHDSADKTTIRLYVEHRRGSDEMARDRPRSLSPGERDQASNDYERRRRRQALPRSSEYKHLRRRDLGGREGAAILSRRQHREGACS